MAGNHAHHYNPRQVTTIEALPDDVLLEIFDFLVVQDLPDSKYQVSAFILPILKSMVEWWQPLVHVCRRWRGLVFVSPRRLDLQLCCVPGTAPGKALDVWPALPLVITMDDYRTGTQVDTSNLISALKHSNRICQIDFIHRGCLTTSQIEKVFAAMQVPFPELTALSLGLLQSPSETVPVVPDSFLGGSAPRLRTLILLGVQILRLPKLLLSATHLVELHLLYTPHSGYISPEEMVTCLSMLTSLKRLTLGFESPQSCPDQESGHYAPPPPTRTVLPALVAILFGGVNEYLEDLLARIDAPRLFRLWIKFLNDIFFDTPQLIQFVGRTLTFKPPNEARVAFNSSNAWFKLQSRAFDSETVKVNISCREPSWQLSALAQICTSFSPLLLATESLWIYENLESSSKLDWKDGIEDTEWLDFLFPFTAVKNLYLSKQFAPRIAPILQELTGVRMTEVLPTLQNLFLEGFQPSESVEEGIGQFISRRQLTNHPITISSWDIDPEQVKLVEIDD